jgi:C4-dicarboxylate-specific signal transduction histidine kinase
MQQKLEKLSRVKEIAFMGKVTASLSHEIKNTLAIINESVGLMGDLVKRDPPTDWPPHSRLQVIMASVEEQVQRSADIVKRLNQFAHSMDRSVADVDLNEAVRHITILAQRFAILHSVKLKTNLSSQPLNIFSNPFRIQYIIFGCIDRALNCSPKQTEVTVGTQRSGEMCQVTITDQEMAELEEIKTRLFASTSTETDPGEPDLALLVETMSELGGTIDVEQRGEQGNTVILSFPPRIPGT